MTMIEVIAGRIADAGIRYSRFYDYIEVFDPRRFAHYVRVMDGRAVLHTYKDGALINRLEFQPRELDALINRLAILANSF